MPQPSLSEMFQTFGRIGLLSFGGPAAQIGLMQDELVDRHNWISQEDFLKATSFCMLLPGPEAMQIATYVGWQMRGVMGGVLAGLLFVLPGAAVIFALTALYIIFGPLPLTQAILTGIQAVVVAILVQALIRMGGRMLTTWIKCGFAVAGFIAMGIGIPFPILIFGAGILGYVFLRDRSAPMVPVKHATWSIRPIIVCVALWCLPFAMLSLFPNTFLWDVGTLFSKLAVVSFGGAYAVLSYLSQTAVQDFGWLTPPQMVDALGLAETTPGPLILVTQFVGTFAGYGNGGWGIALLAGLLTLWVTFIPCFLWIFAFAPHLEWLSAQRWIAASLSGITAVVIGVIANLAAWFAMNILFDSHAPFAVLGQSVSAPIISSFNLWVAGLTALAIALLIWRKMPVLVVLPAIAGLGAFGHVFLGL